MLDETLLRYALAVLVLVVGLVFLWGLYRFGARLFAETHASRFSQLLEFLTSTVQDARRSQWLVEGLSNWYQAYLEKRNDFWEHYGQVALAVLIVTVLAVLLLAKVISAEAGLPILSAVAGFAIAKTSGTNAGSRRQDPPPPQ